METRRKKMKYMDFDLGYQIWHRMEEELGFLVETWGKVKVWYVIRASHLNELHTHS